MRKPYIRRIIEGIVLILLGGIILVLIPGQIQTFSRMETKMSPSFLPTSVAILIIIMGSFLIIQGLFSPKKDPSITTSPDSIIRVVLAILLTVAYSLLFPIIGFIVTSAIFFAIYSYLFGMRNPLKIIGGGIAASIVVWAFFDKLFNIPLPHGIIF